MKISELKDNLLMEFCGIDDEDAALLPLYKEAAKAYIMADSILKTDEDLDKHEDVTFAYMVLINDMSQNRDVTVSHDKLNPTVQKTLARYSAHLVAGGDLQ